MSVISSSDVSVTLDGNTATAVVTWLADVSSDSAVAFGKASTPDVTAGRVSDPIFIPAGTLHTITLRGLDPGIKYWALLASTDERGNPLSCDAVSPGTSCKISFDTPAKSGPATYLKVSANPETISKGQVSQISISTSEDGLSGASGRAVRFNIHNGNDRGTFSPNPATTDSKGNALVAFTAAKNGKAQIQISVDTLSDGVDVMVNP